VSKILILKLINFWYFIFHKIVKIVVFYFDLSFCVAQKKFFTLKVATSRVNKKIKTCCAISSKCQAWVKATNDWQWQLLWCHDTQHNDTQHKDTQHIGLISDIQHDTQHIDTAILLNFIVLSVMLYLLLCWLSLWFVSLCWISLCWGT
jgi:hypothetical protein